MKLMRGFLVLLPLISSLVGTSHGVGPSLEKLPREMETHVPGCMQSERLTISAMDHYDPLLELWTVKPGDPVHLKIKGTANVEIRKEDGIALYVWSDVMDERGRRKTLTPMKFSLCEQWTGVQCPMIAGTDFEAEIRWNAPIAAELLDFVEVSPVLLEEPGLVSCYAVQYGVTGEDIEGGAEELLWEPQPAVSSSLVDAVNGQEDRTWTAEMSPRFHKHSVSDARRIAGGAFLRGQAVIPELRPRVYVPSGMIPQGVAMTQRRQLRGVLEELSANFGIPRVREDYWSGWENSSPLFKRLVMPDFVRLFSDDLQRALSDHYRFLLTSDVNGPMYVEVSPDADVIPDSFDAREAFPECASVIGRVRDQSDCGSCWAFASTEAFNDRRCIAGIGGKASTDQLTLLSAEDTTACCYGFGCSFSNGCNGGHPASAWDWFTRTGVVTGGDYDDIDKGTTCKPYEFKPCAHHVDPSASGYPACPIGEYPTPQCVQTCSENAFKSSYRSDKRKAKVAYSLMGVADVQRDIMAHGSVTASFSVYSDFLTYSGGVYKYVTGEHMGGHAVKIIGWGTDEATGEDFWLVVNSWNDSWGENGLFRILRGVNECGIEGQIVSGEA